MDSIIADLDSLRATYDPVIERARLKTLRALDRHCRAFIALSPFVCLGTSSEDGADVTPRGDKPGFVRVVDDSTLAIPDWRGNNRLDSLSNIVSNPQVGLLFLIPGVDETLRVNGVARISRDAKLLAGWEANGKRPTSALVVEVREAFLHCGKALIRSKLWHHDSRVNRAALPSYGQMLKDQIQIEETAEEIQKSVVDAYANRLY